MTVLSRFSSTIDLQFKPFLLKLLNTDSVTQFWVTQTCMKLIFSKEYCRMLRKWNFTNKNLLIKHFELIIWVNKNKYLIIENFRRIVLCKNMIFKLFFFWKKWPWILENKMRKILWNILKCLKNAIFLIFYIIWETVSCSLKLNFFKTHLCSPRFGE